MAVEHADRQVFRRVCSAGEALSPEAIRWFREQYGVTVLDCHGLSDSYPLVSNFPFTKVREGSMGKPMPVREGEVSWLSRGPLTDQLAADLRSVLKAPT